MRYSILIDVTPKGPRTDSSFQRLKQGDRLSPFLFLIVVDVFSWFIFKGVEGNMIDPFTVGRMSHLQFVHDTMLFS